MERTPSGFPDLPAYHYAASPGKLLTQVPSQILTSKSVLASQNRNQPYLDLNHQSSVRASHRQFAFASAHNIAWPTGAFCGQVDRVICAGLMSVVVPKKDEIGTSGTQEAFSPLVVTLHRSDQSIIGLWHRVVLQMKHRHVYIPRIGRNASKRFGLSSNRQLP